MKLLGVIGDEGPNCFWYEGNASRGWHRGVPVFVRILATDPRRFAIVNTNGEEIEEQEQSFIDWSTRLETLQLREQAAEKLYARMM